MTLFTHEQIVDFYNEAIHTETGINPNNSPENVDFDKYEVIYDSANERLSITLFNVSIKGQDFSEQNLIHIINMGGLPFSLGFLSQP